MVQAIDAVRLQATPTTPPPGATAHGADAYRAGWRSPEPSPSPGSAPTPPPGPRAANDADLVARAKENALLSADVYQDAPQPPAGFHVASAQDLDRLGLTPDMLESPGSSFRARVYATGDGEQERFVIAFRGSKTGEDWENNLQQAAGFPASSYAKALEIGKVIARSDEAVTFTGHSLGGGLASEAAIASGREADSFNAAGLAPSTIAQAQAVAQAEDRGVAPVQAYHVPGDILTLLQNGGDRAIGGALGDALAGPAGGVAGAAIVDAPEAYGTQHAMPDVRPDGVNRIEGLNPISRHGIDWVLAGAIAM
jgi:hypothetical protein